MSDGYCCTEHFYEVTAGERFFNLVVEEYEGLDEGIFLPQIVPWLTVRDGDIGSAVGVLMTALRHRADHVEWLEYLRSRKEIIGAETW